MIGRQMLITEQLTFHCGTSLKALQWFRSLDVGCPCSAYGATPGIRSVFIEVRAVG